MRTVMLATITLAAVACGMSPAETVWSSCDQDVAGYSAVLDGDSIIIRSDPDPTDSQRRLTMEDAACTLGRAGAPDQVWDQVAATTPSDPISREQWDGWQVVWSVQHGQVLDMTVSSR